MLKQDTRRKIDSARDILVGKVPDPKAQVEQITTALIYKFMDDLDKESEELGGKPRFFVNEFEKYAWTKLFDTRLGGFERLNLYVEALLKMPQNKYIPQLFRDILKDAFLPYRDPETLTLFLKEINDFTYDHSENLGDAYEYLLSVLGSQGDAGQFRTPRHIIDFIIEVIDPKKHETILDPACGTAGFLISGYKHILRQNTKESLGDQLTPDEKKKLMNHFMGYDIAPDMVRLSLTNMYLHSFPSPNIYEYDTLTSEERWDETYDVIMANPPFMSPKGGIRPHKRFTTQATRSEVLFVDYIAEHLNVNGRAGVIVPEGIIFQSGGAYKSLRKMLVEDSYLYAVVSLPAGIFQPYSGVKTSILLIDKSLAKKTDNILFIKVSNDGFDLGAQRREKIGSDLPSALELLNLYKNSLQEGKDFEENILIPDAQFIIVEKKKLAKNGDYNLSGERYRENSIKQYQKYPIVELGEVCKPEYGFTDTAKDQGDTRFIRITDIDESGSLKTHDPKFINLSDESRPYLLHKGDLLVARTGATYGKTLFFDEAYQSVFASYLIRLKFDSREIINKYYWFLTQSEEYHKQKMSLVQGGGQPQFNGNVIVKIKIPIPPLGVQQAIVEELETYQKIINGAKQVVENYYPKINVDNHWEKVMLGEVAQNYDSKRKPVTKSDRKEGKYPYYGASGIVDYVEDYIFDEELLLISEDGANLLARNTPIAFSISGKTWVNNHAHVLKFENIKTQKFVEIFLNSINLENYITGSAQPKLNQEYLNSILIPLPPLTIRNEIITKLEEEQKLVDANKRLIEIFEQKIKDKIAEVWGESER